MNSFILNQVGTQKGEINYVQHNRPTPSWSKDFIWLVLFVSWFDFGDISHDNMELEVLELFSGVARVARFARRTGYRTRAFDICYDKTYKRGYKVSTHNGRKKRSFMDLNGEAGLVSLACIKVIMKYCHTHLYGHN